MLALLVVTSIQIDMQVMGEFLLLIHLQPQGDKGGISLIMATHFIMALLMVQEVQVVIHGIQVQMLVVQVGFM